MSASETAPASGPASRLAQRLARAGTALTRPLQRVVPDPFVLALGLLAVVVVAALLLGQGPAAILGSALAGMMAPGQLSFALQMALVLITGSVMAQAPLVRRALNVVAALPGNAAQGVMLVAAVAMGSALLNWGFSVVLGAVLARAVGEQLRRRSVPVPYGVVGAAGYTGLAVWHGGLSGSAPLKVATAGAFGPAIPINETLFSTANIVVTALSCAVMLAVLLVLSHAGDDGVAVPTSPPTPTPPPASATSRVSTVLFIAITVVLGAAVVHKVVVGGTAAVGLDVVIVGSLTLGFLLFWRQGPEVYGAVFTEASKEASGVLLQFPLYFAVIGVAVDSGLVQTLASATTTVVQHLPIADVATSAALSTYWSAAVVNMVVPSGGGQWAVQSPIIAATSEALHLTRAPLVMAFAWGDQVTNLLQPFWALPLLSITGLRARDLLSATALCLIAVFVVVTATIVVIL